jgi:hypothetical protein
MLMGAVYRRSATEWEWRVFRGSRVEQVSTRKYAAHGNAIAAIRKLFPEIEQIRVSDLPPKKKARLKA